MVGESVKITIVEEGDYILINIEVNMKKAIFKSILENLIYAFGPRVRKSIPEELIPIPKEEGEKVDDSKPE